jgi:hypothetical protein
MGQRDRYLVPFFCLKNMTEQHNCPQDWTVWQTNKSNRKYLHTIKYIEKY